MKVKEKLIKEEVLSTVTGKNNDRLFLSKGKYISSPVYLIDKQIVKICKPKEKKGEYENYYPTSTGIIYIIVEDIYVLFGKDFTKENLEILLGILFKLKDADLYILVPPIEDPPEWYRGYCEGMENLKKSLMKLIPKPIKIKEGEGDKERL